MKAKVFSLVFLLSLAFNSYIFSQDTDGRLLTQNELVEVYNKALENTDVIAFMETLKE